MAIRSSQPTEHTRTVTSDTLSTEERISEISLRPKRLEEYIGQEQMKAHLSVAIHSAKIRNTPLEHILFYGPP